MGRPSYLSLLGHQHHVNQSHSIFICLDFSLFWQLDHMLSGARVSSGGLCNLHWIWFLICSTTMCCWTNSGEKKCGRNIRKKRAKQRRNLTSNKRQLKVNLIIKANLARIALRRKQEEQKFLWYGQEVRQQGQAVGKETESHIVIRKMFTFRGSILRQCCFLFYMYI